MLIILHDGLYTPVLLNHVHEFHQVPLFGQVQAILAKLVDGMLHLHEGLWLLRADHHDAVEVGEDVGVGAIAHPLELVLMWIIHQGMEGLVQSPHAVAMGVGTRRSLQLTFAYQAVVEDFIFITYHLLLHYFYSIIYNLTIVVYLLTLQLPVRLEHLSSNYDYFASHFKLSSPISLALDRKA